MGYREREYERLAKVTADLDELLASRGNRDVEVFIERLPAPAPAARDASSVPTQAEIEADRLAGWKQWIRNLLAAERQYLLDNVIGRAHEATGEVMVVFVNKKLAKLEARLAALETRQRAVDDGGVIDLPSSPTIRKIRSA